MYVLRKGFENYATERQMLLAAPTGAAATQSSRLAGTPGALGPHHAHFMTAVVLVYVQIVITL